MKDEIKSAALMVAAGRTLRSARKSVSFVLEKAKAKRTMEFLDSDSGKAAFTYVVGELVSHIPVVGKTSVASSVSRGLKVSSMAMAANSVLDRIFKSKEEDAQVPVNMRIK